MIQIFNRKKFNRYLAIAEHERFITVFEHKNIHKFLSKKFSYTRSSTVEFCALDDDDEARHRRRKFSMMMMMKPAAGAENFQ